MPLARKCIRGCPFKAVGASRLRGGWEKRKKWKREKKKTIWVTWLVLAIDFQCSVCLCFIMHFIYFRIFFLACHQPDPGWPI